MIKKNKENFVANFFRKNLIKIGAEYEPFNTDNDIAGNNDEREEEIRRKIYPQRARHAVLRHGMHSLR